MTLLNLASILPSTSRASLEKSVLWNLLSNETAKSTPITSGQERSGETEPVTSGTGLSQVSLTEASLLELVTRLYSIDSLEKMWDFQWPKTWKTTGCSPSKS